MQTSMIADNALIKNAALALKKGLLVAFPTETVYGLGADAANKEALKLLYRVKGRPLNHPVIVHIADIKELSYWAKDVPAIAYRAAEKFWPGPLTMVLYRQSHVLDEVTGGQATIGLRIPNHPIALALLKEFAAGIAAPSANKFGSISATCAEAVATELGTNVAYVLNGGTCAVGIESTILDLTNQDYPRILRPGMIPVADLEPIVGSLNKHNYSRPWQMPGSLISHYAPKTPLEIIPPTLLAKEVKAKEAQGLTIGVLAFSKIQVQSCSGPWLVVTKNPAVYAYNLYRNLRFLDKQGLDLILAESLPEEDAWSGIRDRLGRAASRKE